MVGNLNKLTFTRAHQGLLFDDMNFSELRRAKTIAITDIANDRDIRILFGIHTIIAGTPRIYTSNEGLSQLFNLTYLSQAIRRRLHVVDVAQYGILYNTPTGGEY